MEVRSAQAPNESFPRAATLRRRMDYMRCYRRGRRRHGSMIVLHVHPNREAFPRLGITASRKVGKAVVRHGIKRRIREIFRRWPARSRLAPLDIVAHVKTGAAEASFDALKQEVERLLDTLPKQEQRA